MRSVRWWLAAVIAVGLTFAGAPAAVAGDATGGTGSGGPVLRGIDLERATVLDLQQAMDRRRLSSVALTAFYLRRIRTVDPRLHAVIETNPHALREAAASDLQRRRHGAPQRSGRHPGAAQGQRRHRRPATHHGRLVRAARRPAGARRVPGEAAARRRRGHPRQGQPVRVGQLPLDHLVQRMERPRRADQQPVRARPQPVRLQQRLGRGRGREPGHRHHRHRDRRLDRVPVRRQRRRRDQADARAGQPGRRHPHLGPAGHRRADDAQRDRRGGRALGDPGRRPARPGDRTGPAVRRRDYLAAAAAGRLARQADRRVAGGGGENAEVNAAAGRDDRAAAGAGRHRRSTLELPGLDVVFDAEFPALLVEFKHDINAYLAATPGSTPAGPGRPDRVQPGARGHRDAVLRAGDLRAGPGDQRRPDRPDVPAAARDRDQRRTRTPSTRRSPATGSTRSSRRPTGRPG